MIPSGPPLLPPENRSKSIVSKEADMGRCTVTRWAFVAGLLCFCGCTGPRTFSPFGWMHGSDSTQASSTPDKTNPLKPADPATPDDGSKPADDTASADGKTPEKPGDNGYKTAAVDPELRKLMLAELCIEPPEERQRLFNQWSKFDPAFIRELVENHRMSRETAENRDHPVKLASADAVQDRAGQAPDLDVSPPSTVSRAAAPADPAASNPTPPASANAANPWSDSSDMPAVPTIPSGSTASGGTAAHSPNDKCGGGARFTRWRRVRRVGRTGSARSADLDCSIDAASDTQQPG